MTTLAKAGWRILTLPLTLMMLALRLASVLTALAVAATIAGTLMFLGPCRGEAHAAGAEETAATAAVEASYLYEGEIPGWAKPLAIGGAVSIALSFLLWIRVDSRERWRELKEKAENARARARTLGRPARQLAGVLQGLYARARRRNGAPEQEGGDTEEPQGRKRSEEAQPPGAEGSVAEQVARDKESQGRSLPRQQDEDQQHEHR